MNANSNIDIRERIAEEILEAGLNDAGDSRVTVRLLADIITNVAADLCDNDAIGLARRVAHELEAREWDD